MMWLYALFILMALGIGLLTLIVIDGKTTFWMYCLVLAFYGFILYSLNKTMHFLADVHIPAGHFRHGVNHILNNAKE